MACQLFSLWMLVSACLLQEAMRCVEFFYQAVLSSLEVCAFFSLQNHCAFLLLTCECRRLHLWWNGIVRMNGERMGDISPRTGHSISCTNIIIGIVVRRGEGSRRINIGHTMCVKLSQRLPVLTIVPFVREVLLSWLFYRWESWENVELELLTIILYSLFMSWHISSHSSL